MLTTPSTRPAASSAAQYASASPTQQNEVGFGQKKGNLVGFGKVHLVWFGKVFGATSVVDPNTLNLDPDPGFWLNLDPDPGPDPDPDPGLYYQF